MAFSVTEISIDKVFNSGGYEIIVTGVFEDGGSSYSVTIGSDGVCYSGIPGQGNVVYPENGVSLYAYTPMLEPTVSTPYSVTVINLSTLESHTLSNVLTVVPKQYLNKIYSFRRMLSPDYLYGAGHIKEEKV